jgi:hypothetical protein
MLRVARSFAPARRLAAGSVLLAASILLCAAAELPAQELTFIPAAPPEGAELPYNIPLPEWMVPPVLELKRSFSDGLSAEFSEIADNETGGGVRTVVESGEQLAGGADRLRAAIRAISEIDVTFGIEGIARIIPAEGALRDTLFGFVVWHETSTRNSKPLMEQFEGLVERVVAGGEAAGQLARQLAAMEDQLNQAMADEDMDRVAELAPGIVEIAGRIDAISTSVASTAAELAALIAELSDEGGAQLAERWAETQAAVAQCIEPAGRTTAANRSVSEVLYLMVELGRLLGTATESVRLLESPSLEDGMIYIPWTVMRNDWELAKELEHRILGGGGDHAGEHQEETAHAEGEHAEADEHEGHAHGQSHETPGVREITGATDETKRNIRALYAHHVEANGILAERAVSYTSMVVGRAMDRLEAFYKADAGYDPEDDERRQKEALAEVDESLRENLPLVAARMSAAGARAALLLADEEAAGGPGHEIDALYQYQNAWLHALNAGSAAQRAVLVIHER